ncbi:MAG: tyrosine-type recombinase/integrase [Proteobacteria bacterium]|nr:tyrosine-type recombinase/integrase [Pseudomonadota bacterium]
MQIKSSFLKRAEFKEFNLNKRIWTIPEHKMKARKEHVIPLSDEAINIIKLMRKKHNHEYVFLRAVHKWVLQPKKLLRKFRYMPDSVWGGDFDHSKHYLSNTLML